MNVVTVMSDYCLFSGGGGGVGGKVKKLMIKPGALSCETRTRTTRRPFTYLKSSSMPVASWQS